MLAVAPLCLMVVAANLSAHAQTSDNVIPSGTSASTTSSPADWTQFHRDNMQRWNPYETVLNINNVGSLKVKWSYVTADVAYSSPAVANGVVYIGNNSKNLYALNASTGQKLWSYAAGVGISSPAVANGIVYVGSGVSLLALNASTGAKLWSYATGGAVVSSPAVANGVVYFGSDDGSLYALKAGTGAKLWSYATKNFVECSPVVANGVVYVVSFDGNVYALNAGTGAKLWSYFTGAGIQSSTAVANGVVYVGGGDLFALSASTGALLWSFATGQDVGSSFALANGAIYFSSDDGSLYALNASTGAALWSFTPDFGFVGDSPAVANGVVYVGAGFGVVYALNASTGRELWSYTPAGGVVSSPAVVNGTLYIASTNANAGTSQVYAFSVGADLFLRLMPSTTTVYQGDLLTYAFPVWNLGPGNAVHEVLMTQVPAGTTFDYIRISGTPGLGTCTTPPYQGTGQIVCHQNASMAPNTTWTVRLTVKVTAPSGTVITENAATMANSPDPNMANNTATARIKVQ
jgi:outer membrane protein assembly factor BamB